MNKLLTFGLRNIGHYFEHDSMHIPRVARYLQDILTEYAPTTLHHDFDRQATLASDQNRKAVSDAQGSIHTCHNYLLF